MNLRVSAPRAVFGFVALVGLTHCQSRSVAEAPAKAPPVASAPLVAAADAPVVAPEPELSFPEDVQNAVREASGPRAPRPPQANDWDEVRAYFAESHSTWLRERITRVRAAQKRLEAFATTAGTPEDREHAAAEALRLWTELENEAITVPASAGVADKKRLTALAKGQIPRDFDEAKSRWLNECLGAMGPSQKAKTRQGRYCLEAERVRVAALEAERAKQREAEDKRRLEAERAARERVKRTTVPLPNERALVPSQQTRPCELSGSVRFSFATFSAAFGKAFTVDGMAEATRVVVPSRADEPVVVTLAWPIEGEFTLPSGTPFLELSKKLDVIKSHMWLEPGAAVSAFGAPGTLTVQALLDGVIDPLSATGTAQCSEVALVQQDAYAPLTERKSNERKVSSSFIELFASARADAPLAVLSGGQIGYVTVLTRQGEYAKIRAKTPLAISGWIKGELIEPTPEEMQRAGILLSQGHAPRSTLSAPAGSVAPVLGAGPKDPPQHVTAPLELRLAPSETAPVVGKLPVGQYVRRRSVAGAFVGIKIASAFAENDSGEFFVRASELEASVRE